LAAAWLPGCDSWEQAKEEVKADQCATARFQEQMEAWQQGRSEPGEKSYRVFGQGGGDAPTGRAVRKMKVSDAPLVYEVAIPFCFERERAGGGTEKCQAEFRVRVKLEEGGDGEATVLSQQVVEGDPLSGSTQVVSWLTQMVPCLIGLWITITWRDSPWAAIPGLITVWAVGYASYHCFDTWVAVPLGLLAFVVLGGLATALLVGLWAAMKRLWE
jgi:hypothetical protein